MKPIKFTTQTKKFLSDKVTPVGLYLQLRDKYHSTILLESSDYRSKEDSFSFICIEPIVSIKALGNKLSLLIKGEEKSIKNIDEKFTQIFQEFKDSIQVSCDDAIKAVNGLYGYSTYESVQYFEKIKLNARPAESTIPEMHYAFYRFIIAINHFNDELTIIENIEKDSESRIDEIENIIKIQAFNTQKFELTGEETSNCTDDYFIENVRKAKEHCQRGDVFQLVLSRQFSQGYKGDEFNVYRALRNINPSPYLFYFDYGNFKLIGSSPEAQLKIKDDIATINPIAGTFRKTGDPIKDAELGKKLAADKKENAEHIMLVDLARNDLSKHSKEVKVEVFKEVQFFSHVIHLVSNVKGKVNGKSIEIFGDTFPAGTLSGAPKYKAMQLIDKYENQSRGFYGGAVGVIGLDNSINLAIGIRSFVSKKNKLFYQSGAGIVIDSDENKELEEVNNKLAALRQALTLAEKI